MADFHHFLITRFNLHFETPAWQKDKNHNETLSEEWMSSRLEIFEKYCLPSVLKQTNLNFRWIIFFDIKTTLPNRKIIEKLLFDIPFISIYYIAGNAFQTEQKSYILEHLGNNTKHIITTRVDNDDVLHEKFIEKIQSCFSWQEYMAVNFVKLYTLSITEDRPLKVNYVFSGHFISLIEKIKETHDFIGCYSKGDRFWNIKGKIIQIIDDVYCLELIHNTNVINVVRGIPVFVKKNLSAFQINLEIEPSLQNVFALIAPRTPWRKWLKFKLRKF